MKKILHILLGLTILATTLSASAQVRVFTGSQGGTGIGSATAGDVGDCLTVSDNSPFTYTLGPCGTGSGGGLATSTPWTAGDLTQVVDNGTVRSVATSSLGLPTFTDLLSYLSLSSWYATTTDALDEGSTNLYYTADRDIRFSTSSADYWKTVNNFFATSSADYWLTVQSIGGFSTTSAEYWKGVSNFFSTSSVNYWHSVTDLFSTTSANALINASSTIANASGVSSGNILQWNGTKWVSVATTTLGVENKLTFNSPLSRTADVVSFLFNTFNQWTAHNTFTSLFADIASTTHATTTTLGVNDYADFLGVANPASPPAGTARFHALTTNGFTRFEMDNEAPTNITLGRDNVFIGRNTTASPITKGQAVYVSGSTGNVPNVALAKADSMATLPAVGIALDDMSVNAFGQIMKLGVLSSFNTSTYSTGNTLYVSTTTAGAFVATRPSYPSFVQRMGTVLVSGVGNGSVLVVTTPFVGGQETGTNGNFTAQNLISVNNSTTTSLAITGLSGILYGNGSTKPASTIATSSLKINHTDLGNLGFTASGHTGTAFRLFGTNGSGASAEYATSTLKIISNDILEDTKLFYTDTRVATYINASSTIANPSGVATGNVIGWNGSKWVSTATSTLNVDVSNTTGTLPVNRGGTGRITSTTAYGLIAAGTTATGAHQTLPTGGTTEVLMGGGASALPAWKATTGTGDVVRKDSPLFTTQIITPVVYGGDQASENLTLKSTSNATKGKILFGTGSAYDEVNDFLGVGTTSPYKKLSVVGTSFADNFESSSTTATSTFAGSLEVGNNSLGILTVGTTTNPNVTKGVGLNVWGNPRMTRPLTTGVLTTPQASIQIGTTNYGGTCGDGCGPSFLFFSDDSANERSFLGRLSGFWVNSTNGAEAGGVSIGVRANAGDTTASTEATRWTSAGNMGLGTTTPVTRLHVSNGASATTTVTIGELGLTTSKSCINMNDVAGGARSMYISSAGALVVSSGYCK